MSASTSTATCRLATSAARMDEYQKYCGTANTIGVPYQVIGPDQVKALWPLVNLGDGVDTPRIVGALYHPDDGHIAPADLTMALRKGARSGGAEIHENCEVTAATRTRSGEWKLTTSQGEISCEHVVCATGNYARQTGRMFGIKVPAIPVEHQYIVYSESPELAAYRDCRRSRTRGAARIRCVLLPARGAPGVDSGSLRGRRTGAGSPMACPNGSARRCSRATSTGCCRTSRPRSAACRCSSTAASRTSSMVRSHIRPMAAR
jgi:glycine/D-amino acid oxidase-like deaminating enzyme